LLDYLVYGLVLGLCFRGLFKPVMMEVGRDVERPVGAGRL
jgi:hypothetical protein